MSSIHRTSALSVGSYQTGNFSRPSFQILKAQWSLCFFFGGSCSLTGSLSALATDLALCCSSPLTLSHLIHVSLKGGSLELHVSLLVIKIHLLSKCILSNVILIISPLELIDYHETAVYQEQAYYKN